MLNTVNNRQKQIFMDFFQLCYKFRLKYNIPFVIKLYLAKNTINIINYIITKMKILMQLNMC